MCFLVGPWLVSCIGVHYRPSNLHQRYVMNNIQLISDSGVGGGGRCWTPTTLKLPKGGRCPIRKSKRLLHVICNVILG